MPLLLIRVGGATYLVLVSVGFEELWVRGGGYVGCFWLVAPVRHLPGILFSLLEEFFVCFLGGAFFLWCPFGARCVSCYRFFFSLVFFCMFVVSLALLVWVFRFCFHFVPFVLFGLISLIFYL